MASDMRTFIALLFLSLACISYAKSEELQLGVRAESTTVISDDAIVWFSSLQQVNDYLVERSLTPKKIKVSVAEGIYSGGAVNWTYAHRDTEIFIIAEGKVRFLGDRNTTWMTIRAAKGEASNIHVMGFSVEDFKTAISVEGDREDVDAWNGNNIIKGNRFINIGGSRESISTAVIRFVNSRNNTVSENYFSGMRNEKKCTLLHAVYLAHYSGNNFIANNSFSDGCGDPVRIRDASNDNIIESNIFRGVGRVGIVTQWHCNPGEPYACTKRSGPECLSTGNVARLNRYKGSLPLEKNITPHDKCKNR
ncbi:MAG: right-handed parallel beta-helix repeat-containing protein [Moraxellaceae bacterium]|nr:right-handed parallel beta-helix repeat-containing protein [Moraxellaceae bacterium]